MSDLQNIPTPSRITPDRLIEIGRALALAFAALFTAWCGYQSSRWSGLMSINFSQAGATRVESTRASTAAGQVFLLDLSNFDGWLQATAQENDALADFYQRRFRPELATAFDAWLATDPQNNADVPSTPFGTEAYQLALNQEADTLEARAQEHYQEALTANQTSDNYVLTTVIFALSLFLAAITDRFKWIRIRIVLTGVSDLVLLIGVINVLSYPIW